MTLGAIAVLITGDPTPSSRERHGDYGRLFKDLLNREGVEWGFFDTRLQQYPKDIFKYQTYVITGSASTAHEDEPWILKLKDFIKRLHEAELKILGVCFGLQVVAGALGGETGVNPSGWELGLHRLHWHSEALQSTPMALMNPPQTVLQIHRDHVFALPPGARVLASTPQTAVQAFALDENVLCVQGHPEFFNDIVEDLVTSRAASGVISDFSAKQAIRTLMAQPTRKDWVTWLSKFVFG